MRHHARLAQIEGIKRRPSSRRGYQERYQQIIQLLDRGILSAERIAEATGIKPTTIMTYRSTAEWRERWRSATQKAVESGDSLERICATTGLTPQALRNSCTRYGIILPEKEKQKKAKESKRKPEVDVLITEGKSLGEIGRTVKLTRERIRQYINATGQYEQWRKAREQRKEEQKTLEEHIDQQRTHILFLLKERMKILAKKDSWAAEKAVECWLNNKRYNEHSHSLETLLTILTRYEKAKNRGECLSLEQLGEGLSLWPSSIGIVLRKVGVEPMYGKRERKLTPQATKEALQRVHPILSLTNMSMTDISYFLGIPNYIVQQHHARYGITQKRPKRALCRDGKHGRYLTNAIASIIYKALDSGLSERKIAATLEVRPSFIDKAKELRPSIQPTIIQTLQILYNTRKIKTPYLP